MTDVVVIGGGIAGVSAAARLAEGGMSVTILEAENTLSYHTTGRSAALYFESYGHESIRGLTKASKKFFLDPDDGLADGPLHSPRGALTIADAERGHQIELAIESARTAGTRVDSADTGFVLDLVPAVRPEFAVNAMYEPGAFDLDVAGIHQAFVRLLRRHGGEIETGARINEIRHGNDWVVRTGKGEFRADLVVNAAGAWADEVATMAGAHPVGLQPLRRTAFMVSGTEESSRWPLVADVDHTWYFKPDGTQLLCSPADETPSEPCDARPVDIDIALAIERINRATTLEIRSVRSSWAGLRTFAPDGSMVIGYDSVVPGFFWLVGQGGTGIQTAPAAAQLTADLITGAELARWQDLMDLKALAPQRFS